MCQLFLSFIQYFPHNYFKGSELNQICSWILPRNRAEVNLLILLSTKMIGVYSLSINLVYSKRSHSNSILLYNVFFGDLRTFWVPHNISSYNPFLVIYLFENCFALPFHSFLSLYSLNRFTKYGEYEESRGYVTPVDAWLYEEFADEVRHVWHQIQEEWPVRGKTPRLQRLSLK